MDKVFMPSQCCFCCSLRTGTLTIGILKLIGSILGLLILLIVMVPMIIMVDVAADDKSCDFECQQAVETSQKLMIVGFTIGLIWFVGGIVINSMLIRGVDKSRPSLMTPYIVVEFILLIINIISMIASIPALLYLGMGARVIPALIPSVLSMIITGHFLCVVRAFKAQVQQEIGERHVVLEEKPEIA